MVTKSPTNFYQTQLETLTLDYSGLKNRIKLVALLRLIAFALSISSYFVLRSYSLIAAIGCPIVFFTLFLFLVRVSVLLNRRAGHLRQLLRINREELMTLEFNFSHFDAGTTYVDTDHSYGYDLDIFGKDSLFQYLNRTVTLTGSQKLAGWLRESLPLASHLTGRQQAVKELADGPLFRHDFRAAGLDRPENGDEKEMFRKWADRPSYFIIRKGLRVSAFLLPIITIVLLLLSILAPSLMGWLITLFLLQLAITAFFIRRINQEHRLLGLILPYTQKIVHHTGIFVKEAFSANILEQLQATLSPSSPAVKRLSVLISALDNRLNMVVGIVLNGFLLWDIHCMFRLERWREQHRQQTGAWLDTLAEVDALCSLACFAFNNPAFRYPVLSEQCLLQAEALGHPLIPPSVRVCNDLDISREGTFIIITGANMSGKSTFLRTVGINLILAMLGAPVAARRFLFTPATLFTSMRTSDNLQKNESYFYAELIRLKRLIALTGQDERVFVILDEILKGTNSIDKQRGSRAILERLLKTRAYGLVATHDLELARLEDSYPECIRNICFEIEINGAEISFDYKLHHGITQRMNAMLLMENMGLT